MPSWHELVRPERYFLSRASLHFPFLKYVNAPQVRCAGAVSARKPARRWIVPRRLTRAGASAVPDLAEVATSLAEAPAGDRTIKTNARASESLNIGLSLELFSVHRRTIGPEGDSGTRGTLPGTSRPPLVLRRRAAALPSRCWRRIPPDASRGGVVTPTVSLASRVGAFDPVPAHVGLSHKVN